MLTPADEARLHDLLDGRLPAAEARALRERVAREAPLGEAYEELERARDLLRGLPDAEPPRDFTARVRAAIDAAGDAEQQPAQGLQGSVGGAGGAASSPHERAASSNGLARPQQAAPPPGAAYVPPAWRRLMVAAYAMAALLVVAIGAISLQRGSRGAGEPAPENARLPGEARDAHEGIEVASAPPGAPAVADPSAELARRADDARSKDAALPGTERTRLEDKQRTSGSADGESPEGAGWGSKAGAPLAGAPVSGPLPPALEPGAKTAAAADAPAPGAAPPGSLAEAEKHVAEQAARQGAPRMRVPALGASGAVQPGLRTPSDTVAPGSGRAPAPSGPSRGRGAPPLLDVPAAGPLDPAAVARDALASTLLADVLLLEADDAVAGRALLDQVLAGPAGADGDRKAKDAGPAATRPADKLPATGAGGADDDGSFQPVRLRRADVRTDAVLLTRLGVIAPGSGGGDGAGPGAAGGGGRGAGGAGPSPGPVVWADFSKAISPEQQARLDAVLGPLAPGSSPGAAPAPARPAAPAGATGGLPAPTGAEGAPASSAPRSRPARLVRFIVIAPPPPR